MRSLRKNNQRLWYAIYKEKTPILDEDGFETGETVASYSVPKVFYDNLSAAKGIVGTEAFGVTANDTKTVSTSDVNLPITETSRIWCETEPVLNDDGTADGDSADYSVEQIAKSLNGLMIALKKLPKNTG